MNQKYTSADTSIRQVCAIYKQTQFRQGSTVLDYGGGKYDDGVEYMKRQRGVEVRVYDPYNRTPAHNNEVAEWAMKRAPDYIVCANVLNVIAEYEVIEQVLHNIRYLADAHTIVRFSVYEGDRTGVGKATSKGWQNNHPTRDYLPILSRFFKTVERKGKIIECRV